MESVSGNVAPPQEVAPKGARIASDLVDLLLIPIVLGVLVGLVVLSIGDPARSIILIAVNVGWLIFRDVVYSPGRTMVGLQLVSLSGPKVTPGQAALRNILLMIPIILLFGYIIYNTYSVGDYTFTPEQTPTVSRTVPSPIPDSWNCFHGDTNYGANWRCTTPEYGQCTWTETWKNGVEGISMMSCEK